MRRNRRQSAIDSDRGLRDRPGHRPHTNNHGRRGAQAGNGASDLARLARQLGVPFITGRLYRACELVDAKAEQDSISK